MPLVRFYLCFNNNDLNIFPKFSTYTVRFSKISKYSVKVLIYNQWKLYICVYNIIYVFIGLALLEGKIYFDLHKTLTYEVLSITVAFSKKFVLISFLSLQPFNPLFYSCTPVWFHVMYVLSCFVSLLRVSLLFLGVHSSISGNINIQLYSHLYTYVCTS